MHFRPCIDLHDGKVKQIVGGTLTDDGRTLHTNFESPRSAGWFARLYQADGLSGGHVIKLGPGNDAAAREALAAAPGTLQIGGGVTPQNAQSWLDAGASGVIVTSYLIDNGAFSEARLAELTAAVPREKLILDLSCRRQSDGRYLLAYDRWQRCTDLEIGPATLQRLADSCGEFLIHAVNAEGRRAGIDAELVTMLADSSPIPCTYAGGAASFADLEKLERCGRGRIDFTIGSALDLFGGDLPYCEIAARYR